MPSPNIDEHSHSILKTVRDNMKEQGQRASLSDAIREIYSCYEAAEKKNKPEGGKNGKKVD